MEILDLEMTHFGKFHHKKLAFHSGLNVIYGENEAGKSTIHAFIRGMLFGMERQRGRLIRSDRYNKYEPWDNHGEYCGVMRIRVNGSIYRLERSFLKTNRSFRLINETAGTMLEPAQTRLEDLLGGMTENSFTSTVCIEQLKCATDASLINELQCFLSNTSNTQSAEIDMAGAIANLKTQRRRLENRLSSTVTKRLTENQNELDEREKELERLRKEEEERKEERLELGKTLNDQKEQIVSMKRAYEEKKEEFRQRYEKARDDYHEYYINTYELNKKNGTGAVLIGLSLFFACFAGYLWWINSFRGFVQTVTMICLLVAAVGCLVSSYFQRKYFLAQREKIKQKVEEKQEKKKRMEEYEDDYKRYSSEFQETTPDTYVECLDRIKAVQDVLNRIDWDKERKEENRIMLLNEREQLLEQESENIKLQLDIDAITLAMETIQKLADKVQRTFGVDLNEEASRLLEKITGGKYQSIVIRDDRSIFLNTSDRYVPLSGVSRGTMEQIYLCIRLAAAKILWKENNIPFLFDDTFVFYDEERLRQTLDFLSTLPNQIILFTSHKRELEYTKMQRNT